MERRDFIALISAAAGSWPTMAAGFGTASARVESFTVGDVIERIYADIPRGRREGTVDTLKIGRRTDPVRGIATTFMATCDVVERAVAGGASLIITHEPTFYNHRDETDWLQGDPVYARKRRYLEELELSVFRFHDFIHSIQPDPVQVGLIEDIGWQEYQTGSAICEIPETTLGELAQRLKSRLGLSSVRYVGKPGSSCRRIGLEPGASGGQSQISAFQNLDLDCLIVGEVAEWETNIYVRDAVWAGLNRSLIVLGHVQSEDAGMRLAVDWLKPRFPGIPIFHVPALDPFTYVQG